MDFPIAEFMDEDSCYEKLVDLLHPEGLACPRCHATPIFPFVPIC